jgi:hypothetical protein
MSRTQVLHSSFAPARSIPPVPLSVVRAMLTFGRVVPISSAGSPCDMPSSRGNALASPRRQAQRRQQQSGEPHLDAMQRDASCRWSVSRKRMHRK